MRLVQRSNDGAHRLIERRQISHYYIPNRVEIHFKVVVHQDVSHAGYRRPVDLRVPRLVRLVNPLRRLAQDLKIADDCVLERTRGKDSIPAAAESSAILPMHAMTCWTYARCDFTTARLHGEQSRGSKD
jgi:hypothetical protein